MARTIRIESASNPVWVKRAKKLQAHLKLEGPQTWNELLTWARTCKFSPTLLTNIMAFAEDSYICFMKGKWWSMPVELNKVEAQGELTKKSEGHRDKSESTDLETDSESPLPHPKDDDPIDTPRLPDASSSPEGLFEPLTPSPQRFVRKRQAASQPE